MFLVHEREIHGESMLNDPAKIAFPKSFANSLGNVFVSNGTKGVKVLELQREQFLP